MTALKWRATAAALILAMPLSGCTQQQMDKVAADANKWIPLTTVVGMGAGGIIGKQLGGKKGLYIGLAAGAVIGAVGGKITSDQAKKRRALSEKEQQEAQAIAHQRREQIRLQDPEAAKKLDSGEVKQLVPVGNDKHDYALIGADGKAESGAYVLTKQDTDILVNDTVSKQTTELDNQRVVLTPSEAQAPS